MIIRFPPGKEPGERIIVLGSGWSILTCDCDPDLLLHLGPGKPVDPLRVRAADPEIPPAWLRVALAAPHRCAAVGPLDARRARLARHPRSAVAPGSRARPGDRAHRARPAPPIPDPSARCYGPCRPRCRRRPATKTTQKLGFTSR